MNKRAPGDDELAQLMREFRETHRKPQDYVASEMGIHKDKIRCFERGEQMPTIPELRRFGKVVGLTATEWNKLESRLAALVRGEPRQLTQPSDESPPIRLDEQVQRAKIYAEAPALFQHRTITSLHLLFSLCEEDFVFIGSDDLRNLLKVDTLRQYLEGARVFGTHASGYQIAKGYQDIFKKAKELASQERDIEVNVLHLLRAISEVKPNSIKEYLQYIKVSWEQFSQTYQVRQGPPSPLSGNPHFS